MMQFRLPLVLRHTKGGGRRGRKLELTAVRTCETAETTTLHGPFPHCSDIFTQPNCGNPENYMLSDTDSAAARLYAARLLSVTLSFALSGAQHAQISTSVYRRPRTTSGCVATSYPRITMPQRSTRTALRPPRYHQGTEASQGTSGEVSSQRTCWLPPLCSTVSACLCQTVTGCLRAIRWYTMPAQSSSSI